MNALKTYGVAVVGALLLVVGVVVLLSQQLVTDGVVVSSVDATGPALEPSTSDPALGVVAAILALVGLVLVAGWVGFRAGHRAQGAQSRS